MKHDPSVCIEDAIIGFRNVIAHGYDVVEDAIVWESVENDVPSLLEQLKQLQVD